MVKMAFYAQKCEQKWLKINKTESWNKDVLGGKKLKKLTIREGGDYSGLKSKYWFAGREINKGNLYQ